MTQSSFKNVILFESELKTTRKDVKKPTKTENVSEDKSLSHTATFQNTAKRKNYPSLMTE